MRAVLQRFRTIAGMLKSGHDDAVFISSIAFEMSFKVKLMSDNEAGKLLRGGIHLSGLVGSLKEEMN